MQLFHFLFYLIPDELSFVCVGLQEKVHCIPQERNRPTLFQLRKPLKN